MSTVPGFPGFKPRVWPLGTLTVTVTSPEISETLVMASCEEDLVTSMPLRMPAPPGVTKAKWECGTIPICGYGPVFKVTCANTQGAVVWDVPGKQVCVSLFRSRMKPTLASVGFALEEYATSAILVSPSTPTEYGTGRGETLGEFGSKPAREMVNG